MIECRSPVASSEQSLIPDMTALLDVIFILLVFLLLTANAVPHVLDVDLPQKGIEQAHPADMERPISITLFAEDARWGLDGQEYANWLLFELALLEQVRQKNDAQIIIAGDKDAPLEKVLQVFSWLQGHHLKAAQVMMQPDL